MTDLARHWAAVWADKEPDETSWFQDTPEPCSALIRSVSTPSDRVVLVGAGASELVADLMAHGYGCLEALDIAAGAIRRLRAQLGDAAGGVRLRQVDVRTARFDEPVDVWHDRATFHFLTDAGDRAAYVAGAARAVRHGGHVVVATFALDGPEQCSGLPVARYDASSLAAEFTPWFELVDSLEHEHRTPWGSRQPFVYAVLRRSVRP